MVWAAWSLNTFWISGDSFPHVRLLMVMLWPVIAITGPQWCLPTSTSLYCWMLPALMNE